MDDIATTTSYADYSHKTGQVIPPEDELRTRDPLNVSGAEVLAYPKHYRTRNTTPNRMVFTQKTKLAKTSQ
jgi:hypothetical protein